MLVFWMLKTRYHAIFIACWCHVMSHVKDAKLEAGLAAMQKFFPTGLDVSDIASTRSLLARLQGKRRSTAPDTVCIADVRLTTAQRAAAQHEVHAAMALAQPSGAMPCATSSLSESDVTERHVTGSSLTKANSTEPLIAALTGSGTQPRLPQAPLTVRCYRPRATSAARPALVWLHGGGFMFGELDWDDKRCQQMALAFDCVVIAVDYALAPEHPFPAALTDAYAALRWVVADAAAQGIDPTRIAVAGASAGGGLAAGLALLARDRAQISICFQLLLYPMLDDRTVLRSAELPDNRVHNVGSAELTAAELALAEPASLEPASLGVVPKQLVTPGWSLAENTAGWQCYLGRRTALKQSLPCHEVYEPSLYVSPYAAASRAQDLAGLPPAFIGVGSSDLFYAQCCDYAKRLQQAGVAVELQCYADAFHGFDSWASTSDTAQRFWAHQVAAMRRAWQAATS